MPPLAAQASPASTYLPAFTGIRAIAAYMVFLHHFNPFYEGGSTPLLHYLLVEFHIGVPVFFVLSGFLITLRYIDHIRFTTAWWKQYLRNRFARIYPMFFLITCLNFAWLYHQEGTLDSTVVLTNVLLLRGFFESIIYSGIPQGWTLTVEECFYLLAPIVFWLLLQRRIRLWYMPFGLLAIGCGLVFLFRPLEYYGLFANFKFMLLFTFFGRCIEFFAGIQLALWYRRGRIRRYAIPSLLTSIGCLMTVAVLVGLVWIRGPYAYGQEHPFGVAFNNVALPGGILVLFAGLLTEQTWLRQLLSSTLLQVLGKSSYIFYLIHFGVIQQFVHDLVPFEGKWLNLISIFLVLNLLAIALHYLVEQPLNNLIRRQPIVAEHLSSVPVS
ncbi:acyltransferase family protein [Hymenobacter volaticus]|uniref:Acyltransferase n=1 Tax=Hymenobacter volaticus TaxID=2932254 RepID=A0ABY4G9T8_9BACT|nr:acyltransferase [Hymenobacter volaticus]UOQ67516.1 acyltransferase [Hymenobacter volaticus]